MKRFSLSLAWFKNNIYLLMLFSILFILKVILLDRGAFASSDEWEYLESFYALKDLQVFDFKGFFKHLSSANAIPFNTFVKLFPTSIQFVLYNVFDIPILNPESIKIVTFLNVIISLYISYTFYLILQILLKSNRNAFIITALFSFTSFNFAYVRHILPYDLSILIFLFAFLQGINKPISFKKIILLGFLSMIGFLSYTGYYSFTIVIFSLIFDFNKIFSFENIRRILYFGFGAILPLLFFEIAAQIGRVSLLKNLYEIFFYKLYVGDSSISFEIIYYYFRDTEGILGIAVLIFTAFSFVIILIKKQKKNYEVSLLICVLLYLFHASLGYFFESKPMWGRVVRGYFPFFIILISLVINHKHFFKLVLPFLVLTCFQFYFFYIDFKSLAFPRDVLYTKGINIHSLPPEKIINEFSEDFIFGSPEPINLKSNYPYQDTQNLKLINFGFLGKVIFHFYSEYIPLKNEILVFKAKHFIHHPIYLYDELSFEQINALKKKDFYVKIYKTKNN